MVSIFELLGLSSEGVSGAGDTPSGVTSFRDSDKEDKGESGGYLWVVIGVLRFVVRGVSTTKGDTGIREAPPWVTVLWDSVTGKRGSIDDEFLGRAEDLFPAVIWDWETACAKVSIKPVEGEGMSVKLVVIPED